MQSADLRFDDTLFNILRINFHHLLFCGTYSVHILFVIHPQSKIFVMVTLSIEAIVQKSLSYTMGGITKSSTFCFACLELDCLGKSSLCLG